jgi:beta-1,4-mannosyltransferase
VSVITMIPDRNSGNVYNHLLYQALERIDLRYVQVPFSLRYLLRRGPLARFHYLHFHWPEIFFVIRPRQPHRLFGLKGYLHLHAFWLLAKWRGYKLVWTVHEVDVHDLQRARRWHAASRRLLWRLADVVYVHTPDVRTEAERRWGARGHVHTIPIGSYEGAYPATLSRSEARQRLGIPPAAKAFVFFGNIRPYKGVDVLLDAFRALHADHPEAHLIVAGQPSSPAFAAEIVAACRDLPRLHLRLEHVPDAEIQLYLRAADCFVAPYKYIETCSAIYLALAYELPVIIKAEGNVHDFAAHAVGIFTREAAETEAAMRRFLGLAPAELAQLQANTLEVSRQFSWDILKERYREAFAAYEADPH